MAVKNRVKISASFNGFSKEIARLRKFDFANHKKFIKKELTKSQIELLVESIFFASYRGYEGFLREIFLLYCLEKQSSKKPKVKSYLKPRDFEHAEQLIKSSMPFLDWTKPDDVITRSEIYLQNNGHPIKLPYTVNKQQLKEFKKIRNHIAHNSIESQSGYESVVRGYFGVTPLTIPTPGQYLMLPSKKKSTNYILLDFFDLMEKISIDLV
ncbi:MAG: hypothetical protein WAR59_10015 [Ignavibacteriaceae bacterium]